MKVNGNIFLKKQDIAFLHEYSGGIDLSIESFSKMIKESCVCGDIVYYEDSEEWNVFWVKLSEYDFSDEYWQGASSKTLILLGCCFDTPIYRNLNFDFDFCQKEDPKTYGGFQYDGCPTANYVYSKETIDKWHDDWFYNNPDRIDWGEHKHDIWPRYDRLIDIIKTELIVHDIIVPLNSSDCVNCFYEQVVKHKNERERISYTQEVVKKICCANYYHREVHLESLERQRGNHNAKNIYFIEKCGKFIFLCVDTQHGMLEYCDDSGEHIMEIRFDGTKNKEKDLSHSLRCVSDWKRKK